MGISLFNSSSNSVADKSQPAALPNPNPKNYVAEYVYTVRDFLVVGVRYPDCTNYEGRKILVYKGVTWGMLEKQGSLDPHFCNNPEYISPIARFVPTNEGLGMAIVFCDAAGAHA